MRTKLYINNSLVPVSDDISIPFNKEISDIRNPENRNSEYTKTVTIPGSKEINKILSHAFDISRTVINTTEINFNPDFNPNLIALCKVYDSELLVLNGYCQLLQINLLNQNDIEYELAIFGSIGNIFAEIGSLKLSDLDFSQYEHTLTESNIENSWATSIKDSTAGGGVRAFAFGTGYVYPAIDYGLDADVKNMGVQNMRPGIYAKTIVDKIFSAVDYSYTTDSFFNSDLFKHCIIPYTGTFFGIGATEAASRAFSITKANGNVTLGATMIYGTVTGPGSSQYNTSTGVMIFAKAGRYIFSASITYDGTNNLPATAPTDILVMEFNAKKNGVIISPLNLFFSTLSPGPTLNFVTAPIDFLVGDTFEWVFVKVTNINTATVYTATYHLGFSSFMSITADQTAIAEGDTIDMNNLLSPDILQKDFLISLARMFNLQFDTGDFATQLIVKTRDEYLTGDVHDWSKKHDISQPTNIIPMGALDANPYYFTYKADTDYYNKLYSDEFTRNYGDQLFYIENDFIKTKKVIDLIFSPTPLVNEPAWVTDMVVSSIKTFDQKGILTNKGGNIRILYYGGLKATSTGFNLVGSVFTTVHTSYPYAGHLDDPYNSTLDLNFGTPQKIYYGGVGGIALAYTGNNLFEVYHADFIDEITNKDSKIVRAWFDLRPYDVFRIKFSDLYYFMGQYFRLNKLIDHQIGSNELTQAEFVKVGTTADVPQGGTVWKSITTKWKDIILKWKDL